MPKTTYITTPIYYVNAKPHVGHALTMLVCDITKRAHKMMGEEVVFLTGTDENATKVFEAAQEAGEDPYKFVDRISQTFVEVAKLMNVDYDIFYRTTWESHHKSVQALFSVLKERGHVYLDKYEGWYDVSAETFVREADLVDGKSPDGNEVRWVSEENYFFRLSAFGDQLLEHAEKNPGFWLPEGRKSEVVSFIRQGLRDLCITRTNPGWGIPVPGEPDKVIYVWFDALINYLAASGWPDAGWEKLWPADVHWMAKEIFTRFHATLWPAMLLGAGLPLPKTVIAHGWFTFNDSKMSKSKGNVLGCDELVAWFEELGCSHEIAVDSLRFCLARLMPYEGDTNFTKDEIAKHYNADLANDLGNALNRTISMVQKFVDGVVPGEPVDASAVDFVKKVCAEHQALMAEFKIDRCVDVSLEVVRFLNRYIQEQAPWALAKAGDARLGSVLATMLYCLRATEGLIRPYTPAAADGLLAQLGYVQGDATTAFDSIPDPSRLNVGSRLADPQPLFPRIDLKAMSTPEPATNNPKPTGPESPQPATRDPQPEIDITDFMKVNLRVARILEAEAVPNSEKLVKLQVIIGEERRQILAGILKSYAPADLVGRQVIVITNLKPRKLAGLESQGMILAADGPDGSAILLTPESEAPEGTSVH